jgi:PAS domain S-box-containing protein
MIQDDLEQAISEPTTDAPPAVLIVDDSATLRSRLSSTLTENGFRTLEAATAREARETMRTHEPDVIILDVVLPDESGLVLCRDWRVDPETWMVPILLMSGQRLETLDQVAGLEAGAMGYLTKPCDDLVLLAQIRTLLRLHRVQRLVYDRDEQITAITQTVQDALIMLDVDGDITYWNSAATRLFGYSNEEALGNRLCKLVFPHEPGRLCETGPGTDEHPPNVPRSGLRKELTARRKDGSTLPVEITLTAVRLRGVDYAVVTAHDLTERRESEAALEEERRQLLSVFDSIDEPIYVSDPESYELLYANHAFRQRWPWDGKRGAKCHQVLQDHDAPCSFCTNDRIFAPPIGKPYIWEFQNRKTLRWYRCIDRAIRWPDGRWVRCELAIDISDVRQAEEALKEAHNKLEDRVQERTQELAFANAELRNHTSELMRTEQALRDSEHRYRSLVETMNDGLLVLDEQARITYVNERTVSMLGYPSAELLGKPLARLIAREQRRILMEQMALRRLGQNQPYEIVFQCKNGSQLTCRVSPQGLRRVDGTYAGSFAVISDVTEQRKREQELLEAKQLAEQALHDLDQAHSQLTQSDKLASIGQLAAGVAHEINNPMAFISSNLNSLQSYVEDLRQLIEAHESLTVALESEPDLVDKRIATIQNLREQMGVEYILSDLADLVNECIDGAQRVREIVADLKEFSHVDSPEVDEVDINGLLDKTINVAWNELKYKAEVVRDYGDPPLIPAYGGKLAQVFLNLLVNAAQAIPERGTITVRTGTREEAVWIEIEDTGTGMPVEVQNRIFEPFFTTKEPGKGTGLGLHLTYKIISAHGGTIEVHSTPGEGTAFHIALPVAGVINQNAESAEVSA